MIRVPRILPLSIFFLFLVANGSTSAFAYGEFDPTFKSEGIVNSCLSSAEAVTTDGSIYTATQTFSALQQPNILVRNRADGSVDRKWGNGGALNLLERVEALLPVADGGILAIGDHISRFDRNGALDLAFGSQGMSDAIRPTGASLVGVALQANGSVVTLANSTEGWAFTRTDSFGKPDGGFGIGGSFSIPISVVPKDAITYAWSVEADGSVQLAWNKEKTGSPLQFQVQRFRKALSPPDPDFDAGGKLVPRQGVADWTSPVIKVQADGALLIATRACSDVECREPAITVRRYDAFGNEDVGFGQGGKTILPAIVPGSVVILARANSLWLEPDGALTVFISANYRFGSFGVGLYGPIVYRLKADGKIDSGFDNGKSFDPADASGLFLQLDDGSLLRTRIINGVCAPVKYLTDAPRTATVIVEYYSQKLDHYFMTAHEHEMVVLDGGSPTDWKRTGQVFGAFSIVAPMPGTSPVCRYYGGANGGPNSHFYSAEKFECDLLAQIEAQTPPDKPAWRFEREAFRITVPVDGNCPPNLTPVYRLYNRAGVPGRNREPNHRYTTALTIHTEMQAKGWISEGVHMCVPPAGQSDRTP